MKKKNKFRQTNKKLYERKPSFLQDKKNIKNMLAIMPIPFPNRKITRKFTIDDLKK